MLSLSCGWWLSVLLDTGDSEVWRTLVVVSLGFNVWIPDDVTLWVSPAAPRPLVAPGLLLIGRLFHLQSVASREPMTLQPMYSGAVWSSHRADVVVVVVPSLHHRRAQGQGGEAMIMMSYWQGALWPSNSFPAFYRLKKPTCFIIYKYSRCQRGVQIYWSQGGDATSAIWNQLRANRVTVSVRRLKNGHCWLWVSLTKMLHGRESESLNHICYFF